MTLEEILDEIENLVVEASSLPFTDKKIIEENDICRLLDALRDKMPVEIVESRRIINERVRIIEEAQKEAHNIIEQAKAYGMRLTDESVIVRQAQEHAEQIVANAQKSAKDLQSDSVTYADDVFKHIESNLVKALEVVQSGRNDLRQTVKK